jgi:hypothetical protein
MCITVWLALSAAVASWQPGFKAAVCSLHHFRPRIFLLGSASDVFSRRHTQSKVYWHTKGNKKEAEDQEQQQQQQQQGSGLLRQGSGAPDVTLLKQSLRQLEPADLIKVLELEVDLSRLPQQEPGALLSKRLLGPRWFQSVERRQQDMAGRSLLTLDDWKRKMSYI